MSDQDPAVISAENASAEALAKIIHRHDAAMDVGEAALTALYPEDSRRVQDINDFHRRRPNNYPY